MATGSTVFGFQNLENYNANLPPRQVSLGSRDGCCATSGFFPENFFVANPQFSSANYVTNFGHSNYHSLQVQTTFRRLRA